MGYAIGTTYEGKDFGYLKEIIPYVEHIEVSPDSISAFNQGRVTVNESSLQHLQWMQENSNADLLLHGVGLSIGSYDGHSTDYINILSELFKNLDIKWHSEHLAYTMVNGENLGTMLTLPHTDEVITMVCRRIDEIQKKFKVPFLIENVISMLPNPDEQYNDAQFLNKITNLTGCGLILDIYNLQCDEKNFGLNLNDFFGELNLEPVHELHLAGGLYDTEYNFQMDIHAHLTADSTIQLAQTITRKQPKNLQNITFELLEEFVQPVGTSNIIEHLKLLNNIFN